MPHRCSPIATRKFLCFVLAFLALSASVSALGDENWTSEGEHSNICEVVDKLVFDGINANDSVGWQVSLGPRIPGSLPSENFRSSVIENVTAWGWSTHTQQHQSHEMNLTNLFATLNGSGEGQRGKIVISAHYDSRNIADQDYNKSNRSLPVPGANDAASGAAILIELARIIPAMNLSHDITLFWNDAEDQNDNYTEGAKAWADNLSQEEIDSIESFILLDMVGDRDLQLQKIHIGNSTLKSRAEALGGALGMVNGTMSCDGENGDGRMQYNRTLHVIDDHQHPDNLGIPTLSLMDPQYGEYKESTFGEFWHTREDTPDKVSAESLGAVGRIVELGLLSDAFVIKDKLLLESGDENSTTVNQNEANDMENQESGGFSALVIVAGASLFTIIGIIAYAEWKLKH